MAEQVENADGTVTFKLKFPVEHQGKEITSVTLRPVITAADLEAFDRAKGDVAQTIELISELSGLSAACVRKLQAPDYILLSVFVGGCMGNGYQAIGGTS